MYCTYLVASDAWQILSELHHLLSVRGRERESDDTTGDKGTRQATKDKQTEEGALVTQRPQQQES